MKEKTKEKLRMIMKEKEKERTALMAIWLREETGLELNDLIKLPPRFRESYRRIFNIKWRIQKSNCLEHIKLLQGALR
jgi:hypothetical protein